MSSEQQYFSCLNQRLQILAEYIGQNSRDTLYASMKSLQPTDIVGVKLPKSSAINAWQRTYPESDANPNQKFWPFLEKFFRYKLGDLYEDNWTTLSILELYRQYITPYGEGYRKHMRGHDQSNVIRNIYKHLQGWYLLTRMHSSEVCITQDLLYINGHMGSTSNCKIYITTTDAKDSSTKIQSLDGLVMYGKLLFVQAYGHLGGADNNLDFLGLVFSRSNIHTNHYLAGIMMSSDDLDGHPCATRVLMEKLDNDELDPKNPDSLRPYLKPITEEHEDWNEYLRLVDNVIPPLHDAHGNLTRARHALDYSDGTISNIRTTRPGTSNT